MNRQRVWMMFGIAWGCALLLSWIVYRSATSPGSRDAVKVIAASHELQVGQRVADTDLKIVDVTRKDLPAGYIANAADAIGRAVLVKLSPNEPILDGRLAPKLGGEGLAAIIEPGKRAISVQVNETIGVAGFVQPGSKVDVLWTRTLAGGDAAATTILQNIAVLAYGRSLQRPNDKTAAPTPVIAGTGIAVTLLVTQDDAERLALAVQRGKIQLVLRNPLDTEELETTAVYSEDLGIKEKQKATLRPAGAVEIPKYTPPPTPVVPPKPKDPKEGKVVVKVFRGNKFSEDVF